MLDAENTTAAAVTTARLNSLGLLRRRMRSPLTSTNRTATTNTIAPSTQIGRNFSGPVRNNSTTPTVAAVAKCANWLLPPAVSTMAVWVGLPLTTKVPLRPAAASAAHKPSRSRFWSGFW